MQSEATLSSSGTFVVDSPVKRERQVEGEENWNLENLWTPGTLNTQAKRVSEQLTRLTERNIEREMTQQTEMSAMERMLKMMAKMR